MNHMEDADTNPSFMGTAMFAQKSADEAIAAEKLNNG